MLKITFLFRAETQSRESTQNTADISIPSLHDVSQDPRMGIGKT